MGADTEEQQRIAAIQGERRRRLYMLELRAAREGNDCPPEVLTEIEDLRQKVSEADIAAKVVNGGAVSQKVLDVLRELAPNDVIIKTQFMQQMALRDLQQSVESLLAMFARDQGERTERQRQVDQQQYRVEQRVAALRRAVTVLALAWLLVLLTLAAGGWR